MSHVEQIQPPSRKKQFGISVAALVEGTLAESGEPNQPEPCAPQLLLAVIHTRCFFIRCYDYLPFWQLRFSQAELSRAREFSQADDRIMIRCEFFTRSLGPPTISAVDHTPAGGAMTRLSVAVKIDYADHSLYMFARSPDVSNIVVLMEIL
jgi:hypothetical protein